MKVVYMGTPGFAVPTLQALIDSKHEVVGVFTQPDRPKGRGNHMVMPPVKELALEYHIPVYQPVRIKREASVNDLKALAPDIVVVAAFGQLLSQEVLDIPKYGCINVHGSLLPKYRGAAPIQWAVINNDVKTGVAIQQMALGMDEGDLLLKGELTLMPKETAGSLHDRLSEISGGLVLETLKRIELGALEPVPQNHEEATYVGKLDKNMGKIDWSKTAKEIECLVRGLNPWPSAFTYLDGKMLKIWDADVIREDSDAIPGTVLDTSKGLLISCGEEQLRVTSLQLQGKKRMDAKAFLNGFKIEVGTVLGN